MTDRETLDWIAEQYTPTNHQAEIAALQDTIDQLTNDPEYMTAYNAGRDSMKAEIAAVAQGYLKVASIIERNISEDVDENGRHMLILQAVPHTGPAVDWMHKTLTLMSKLLKQYSAKTSDATAALQAREDAVWNEAIEAVALLITGSVYSMNNGEACLMPVSKSMTGVDVHHATIARAIRQLKREVK